MAIAIEVLMALLTLSGVAYMVIALWSARDFVRRWRGRQIVEFAPDMTVLKPVKGVDPQMYAGFASHCVQQYAGRIELLFGVSSMDDAAVAEVQRLAAEYPQCDVRLVECKERLGTSGKVSNLAQMLREAKYEHVLVNDSDIRVSPMYLQNVMRCFADARVGLVTVPYVGQAGERPGFWARLEALGISTDFFAGVLTARKLEGGIRFGLGSTLATTKQAIEKMGGLESLTEVLADDYELGARIAKAGYAVELCPEVVETTVPAYSFKGFSEHQLRWSRSVRDSRKAGYLGLAVTYCIPWALLTCVASGMALWSLTLLSMAVLARVAVALVVGVGILRDGQVLRDLWLLPIRDGFGLFFWCWSFAGDTVVWRGERFRLKDGRLERL